jgi:hypothetical protein
MPVNRSTIADAMARNGYLQFTVVGAPLPSWRYTVGLTELGLPEVLVAGTAAYADGVLDAVVRAVSSHLRSGEVSADEFTLQVGDLEVDVVDAHPSWVERLAVQAANYYDARVVRAVQVRPSGRWVDVPDASVAFDPVAEPAWRWLEDDWAYPVDERTRALVDLAALQGHRIVEVIHEREPDGTDSWTMRVDEEHAPADGPMRLVPFGTMFALDPSLVATLDVDAGEFAVRDDEPPGWRVWTMPTPLEL